MAAISSTRRFHRDMPIDLMKELTINESLSYLESPYMTCIENPRPFGRIVAEKLIETGVLKSGTKVMEAGGGYGSFMESFMTHSGHLVDIAVMTDLSRQLLKKQRARLCRHADKSLFFNADIHDILPAVSGIDLLIMNEVIGDLDTLTDIDPENLDAESRLLIHKYGLEIPSSGGFCLNTGAIRVVEAVCIRGMMAFF